MVAAKSPEWLPSGWSTKVKSRNGRKVKYYCKVESGQKFYSKNEVLRNVEKGTGNVLGDTTQSITLHNKGCSNDKCCPVVMGTIQSHEWLPSGWIVELKTKMSGSRVGSKYKCYIDPVTGRRFFSKPKVLQYLDSIMINNCTTKLSKENIGFSSDIFPVEVARDSTNELPPGWIKEIKTRKSMNKIRKDPYYIDPVCGYIFRSKKDALRYLETGDISKCVMRPKKRDGDNLTPINSEISNKIDGLNGGMCSSEQDASQDDKTIGFENCASEQKTMGIGKNSTNKVAVASVSPDELPPGWIKGTKMKKGMNGIRKDPYYIDPVRGYIFRSKKDVLRYLETGDINKCIIRPKKRDGDNLTPINNELSNKIDCLAGGTSYSDPDASQDNKTIRCKNYAPEQKTMGIGKNSANKVLVVSDSPDELPPGWIKEIRTRKTIKGIKKDPYYTDPVSGYIFRSKRDALRFLETGDINQCAIRPRKRDGDNLTPVNCEMLSSSEVDKKKVGRHTTRREFFPGEKCFDTNSIISMDGKDTSTLKTQIFGKKHSLADSLEACAEANDVLGLKAKGSKSRQAMVSAEKGSVSTHASGLLKDLTLSENAMEMKKNRKTPDQSRSKRKKELTQPTRSSKRLTGLKHEMLGNLNLSERALRAELRDSVDIETSLTSHSALDAPTDGKCQQVESEPGMQKPCNVSIHEEASPDREPKKRGEDSLENLVPLENLVASGQLESQQSEKWNNEKRGENSLENLAASEGKLTSHETEKQKNENPGSQVCYPFGHCWSDPCLEFAFKTLTGEIPVEDSLNIHGFFQQQSDPVQTRADDSFALQNHASPNCFQDNISSHLDSMKGCFPIQQFPAVSTLISPGSNSLPSSSYVDPEEPLLKARNDEIKQR